MRVSADRLSEVGVVLLVMAAATWLDWGGQPWQAEDLLNYFFAVIFFGIYVDILCGGPPKENPAENHKVDA